MTDLNALLAAIVASPDEDTVRLAYADALEEAGEPEQVALAELIRVQCEAERIRAEHGAWTPNAVLGTCELNKRSRELCDANPHWVTLPCPVCVSRTHIVLGSSNARLQCLVCEGRGDLRLTGRDSRHDGELSWEYLFQDVAVRRGLPYSLVMHSNVINCRPVDTAEPTARARALLIVAPTLQEISLLDIRPILLTSSVGFEWTAPNNWAIAKITMTYGSLGTHYIWPDVYRLMTGGVSVAWRGTDMKLFPTEMAAKASLAKAVCQWIRHYPASV